MLRAWLQKSAGGTTTALAFAARHSEKNTALSNCTPTDGTERASTERYGGIRFARKKSLLRFHRRPFTGHRAATSALELACVLKENIADA
jgi:hypothetical protein